MRQLVVVLAFITMIDGMYVYADSPVLKPRMALRQKSGGIKETIVAECEKLINDSSRVIAMLAQQIETIVAKLRALASGDDDFFARAKQSQLDTYKKRLQALRKEVEQMREKVEHELQALEENFGVGKV